MFIGHRRHIIKLNAFNTAHSRASAKLAVPDDGRQTTAHEQDLRYDLWGEESFERIADRTSYFTISPGNRLNHTPAVYTASQVCGALWPRGYWRLFSVRRVHWGTFYGALQQAWNGKRSINDSLVQPIWLIHAVLVVAVAAVSISK